MSTFGAICLGSVLTLALLALGGGIGYLLAHKRPIMRKGSVMIPRHAVKGILKKEPGAYEALVRALREADNA